MTKKSNFKFIDLFAGLGGFHVAMSQIGGECVFASDKESDLRKLYKINHHVNGEIAGDITQVDFTTIPQHDVLCAGFPCQPFSQAGKREGFKDKERGNLFDEICAIISAQGENRPRYLLLENVANLKGHDEGNTWKTIEKKLDALGYEVDEKILSPHQFGIAQHRKRIYIVGARKDQGGLKDFHFPEPDSSDDCSIYSYINEDETDIQPLRLETLSQLKVWQEFVDYCIKYNGSVPRFPIWAMEFGADYPYADTVPAFLDKEDLIGHRGKLGRIIDGDTLRECLDQLPVYAQTSKSKVFPNWKIRYITQNREFYHANKKWLDKWLKKIEHYENSHMKLEWNCGKENVIKIKENIIQFRASGIRVKLPTFSPALNLCGTQVPILPWVKLPEKCIPLYSGEDLKKYGLTLEDIKYGRYLSVHEAAALQGMETLKFDTLSKNRAYAALGNAVNTQVVKYIATNLIKI